MDLRFQGSDVGQVTVASAPVETVADQERIRDFESDVIHLDVDDSAVGAIEQGADPARSGLADLQVPADVCQCQTGIDDILNNQHVPLADAVLKVLRNLYRAGAPTGIAGDGETVQ